MADQNQNDEGRAFMCEFDVENSSAAGRSAFAAPYTCAVCGAGAREATNLCAPELSQRSGS